MIYKILGLTLIVSILLGGGQKLMSNTASSEESEVQLEEELVEEKEIITQTNKDLPNDKPVQKEQLPQLEDEIVKEEVTVNLADEKEKSNNISQPEKLEKQKETIDNKEITKQLSNEVIHDVNTYLSKLSNMKLDTYHQDKPDHDLLLNVGFWLNVFDRMEDVTFEEIDGCYYDVFNYDEFNQKINQYFDHQLEKKGNDKWLFQNNKYYHPSFPTGYNLNTVTQLERVFDNGDGSFLIEASVSQFESSMDVDLYSQYLYPKSTWTTSMEGELIGSVTATMKYSKSLAHYVIEHYEANYFNNVVIDKDNTFTISQAMDYVKKKYGENEDTLYFIGDHIEYDEVGEKYYTVTLKSLSKVEAGESGLLFNLKVYEDGTIIEESSINANQ